MRPVLRWLTALQHALFLTLSVLGGARAVVLGAPAGLVTVASLALLGWYALGVAWARGTVGHTEGSRRPPAHDDASTPHGSGSAPPPGAGDRMSNPEMARLRVWWLLGLTACWLVLVASSAQTVWLAFSLWLLAGHFLAWGWAISYALIVLGVVVGAPWLASGSLSLAEVLGPSIGAIFALAASKGQVQLVNVALERQRLLDSLWAAQQETEALHTQLVATQRASGVLAERARLSRDIHDTLAQGFSSILLLARSGRMLSPEAQLRDLLARIEDTAADNLAQSRRIVAALAPRDLDEAGLPAALRRLLVAFTDETGVAHRLRVLGDVVGLPIAVEVALVRTTQGALANVRTHAQAGLVVVSLLGEQDEVRLDIVDDGCGFDPARLPARPPTGSSAGYGLSSTRARLRELGGGLDVESAPGEGTALSAHVPLRSAALAGPGVLGGTG